MQKVVRSPYLAIAQFGIVFSLIGFPLHFLWEYLQCSPFFRHLSTKSTWEAMLVATAGDLLMMWFVYFVVSFLRRSFVWFQNVWTIKPVLSIMSVSFAIAIAVEFWGLKSGRWAYTVQNPIVPLLNVSLLPLLQMLLINPLSMYFSSRVSSSVRRPLPER